MRRSTTLLFLLLISVTTPAGTYKLSSALCVGPVAVAAPYGIATADTSAVAALLAAGNWQAEADAYPADGKPMRSGGIAWRVIKAPEDSVFSINNSGTGYAYAVIYFYASATVFTEATIAVSCNLPFTLSTDGQTICANNTLTANGGTVQPVSGDAALEPGMHGFALQVLLPPGDEARTTVIVTAPNPISFTTKPVIAQRITDVLDGEKVTMALLSPDGRYSAIISSRYNYAASAADKTLQLFNNESGVCLARRQANGLGNLMWLPGSSKLLFSVASGDVNDLITLRVPAMTEETVARGIPQLSSISASPAGDFLVYSTVEAAKKDARGLRRISEPEQRWPWAGNQYSYYLFYLAAGITVPFNKGELFSGLIDISRDGKKFLLSKTSYDATRRPYSFTTFIVWNSVSATADTIGTFAFGNDGKFSPDGNHILFTGGPGMFGTAGYDIDTTLLPNDYEDELYLYTLAGGAVKPLTKKFNPSVLWAQWATDNKIWLTAVEGSYQPLYVLDVGSGAFNKMDCGAECVTAVSASTGSGAMLITGSGAADPAKVRLYEAKRNTWKILFEPGAERNKVLPAVTVEAWTFNSSTGEQIDGYFYYPISFDPLKKYPLIVNYYGGITPVERAYEGRYPKNYWAGNGYAVLVLQPSGAVGYGQRFAAKHVNDWGKTTAQEIIEGTALFAKQHSWVDSTKIGCIGASYGGYMTMNILTKTSLFRAAVSHAGISSLASYWGQGYWGYLYSSVATANSFPWNRKDIYVEESPLYNAEKISTPLLLLHGAADTNVPPGESRQFYIALKMLGKQAELIEVDGQDHHILEHDKRLLWSKTIVAWFEKQLKGEPAWWNKLYPLGGR